MKKEYLVYQGDGKFSFWNKADGRATYNGSLKEAVKKTLRVWGPYIELTYIGVICSRDLIGWVKV